MKNQTILSGDRLRNDVVGTDNMFSSLDPTQNTTRTDNLHTVVTFDPSSVDVMLDGITIVGGSADGDGNSGRGGGVSLDGIGCGIQRCLFYFNFASKGGAVYMHKNSGSDSQPCFVYNSVLVSNSAFRRDGSDMEAVSIPKQESFSTMSFTIITGAVFVYTMRPRLSIIRLSTTSCMV